MFKSITGFGVALICEKWFLMGNIPKPFTRKPTLIVKKNGFAIWL